MCLCVAICFPVLTYISATKQCTNNYGQRVEIYIVSNAVLDYCCTLNVLLERSLLHARNGLCLTWANGKE